MYSLHKQNKKEKEAAACRASSQKAMKIVLNPQRTALRDQLSNASHERISNLLKLTTTSTKKVLIEGTIPCIHPSAIVYKEKSAKLNFYVRRYMPEKERIAMTVRDYQDTHLLKDKYSNPNEDHLRESSKPFVSSKRFMKSNQNALTRVQSSALFNKVYLLEPYGLDKRPETMYRLDHKDKWNGHKDFNKFISSKVKNELEPITLNIGDKYVEGFEVLGDVSRKRDKSKEIANGFFPNTMKSTWEKTFKPVDTNSNFYSKLRSELAEVPRKTYPITLKEIQIK